MVMEGALRGVDHKSTRTAKAYWGAGFGPLTNLTTHHLGKLGLLCSSVIRAKPVTITNAFLVFFTPPETPKIVFLVSCSSGSDDSSVVCSYFIKWKQVWHKTAMQFVPNKLFPFWFEPRASSCYRREKKKSKKVCPLEKTKMSGCDFFGSLYSELK